MAFLLTRAFPLLLLILPVCTLDVLAATSLAKCINDGSSPLNCSLALIILASIQNAETLGTGALEFAGPPETLPDPHTSDPSAPPLVFADRVSIVVTQSALSLVYPLTYERDVNDAPTEQVLTVDGSGHAFSALSNPCSDAPSDATPSCGWTLDGGGARVPYSQGFCCACGVGSNLVGGIIVRSGLQCDLFAARDSAHCLSMSPLWYHSFAIGPPALSFSMDISVFSCRPTPAAFASAAAAAASNASALAAAAGLPVTPASAAQSALAPQLSCAAPGPGCSCALLDSTTVNTAQGLPPLGPALPTRCYALPTNPDAASCDILFELQGTFAAYEGTPDYSTKRLLVPSACTASTDACVAKLTESWNRWLLVADTSVGYDGTQCNKIGTSYEAFSTQGNPCQQPAGTCLSGSPSALYAADVARIARGAAPLNFLSAFRDTTTSSTPFPKGGAPSVASIQSAGASTPGLAFIVPTQRFQKTVFSITVKADPSTLRFITQVAPGHIVLPVNATPITAGSTGALITSIASDGAVAASFTLVVACRPSDALLPIAAHEVTLGPGATAVVVYALTPIGTLAAQPICRVTLLDALGAVRDSTVVNVSITSLVADRGVQGGTPVGRDGSNVPINATAASITSACGNSCASWYDIACAARTAGACASRIAEWASGIGALLVGGLLSAYLLVRYPALLRRLLSCVSCGRCAGGVESSSSSVGGGGGGSSTRNNASSGGSPRRAVVAHSDAPAAVRPRRQQASSARGLESARGSERVGGGWVAARAGTMRPARAFIDSSGAHKAALDKDTPRIPFSFAPGLARAALSVEGDDERAVVAVNPLYLRGARGAEASDSAGAEDPDSSALQSFPPVLPGGASSEDSCPDEGAPPIAALSATAFLRSGALASRSFVRALQLPVPPPASVALTPPPSAPELPTLPELPSARSAVSDTV